MCAKKRPAMRGVFNRCGIRRTTDALSDQGYVPLLSKDLPGTGNRINIVDVNAHWLRLTFECAIPSFRRIRGTEYFLSPAVEDAEAPNGNEPIVVESEFRVGR